MSTHFKFSESISLRSQVRAPSVSMLPVWPDVRSDHGMSLSLEINVAECTFFPSSSNRCRSSDACHLGRLGCLVCLPGEALGSHGRPCVFGLISSGKDNKPSCVDQELDAPLPEMSISWEVGVLTLRAGFLPSAPPDPLASCPHCSVLPETAEDGPHQYTFLPPGFLSGSHLPEIRGGRSVASDTHFSPVPSQTGSLWRWFSAVCCW